MRFYAAAGALLDLLALPVLLTLLSAGEWVTVTDPNSAAAAQVGNLNFGIFMALLVVTIVVAVDALWEAYRFFVRRRMLVVR